MSLLLLRDVHTHTPTQSIFKTEACSQVFNHLWHPEAMDVTEASALKAFNIRERWRCLTVLLVDAIAACRFPPQVHWICLFFFCCKRQIRKSEKQNQTFHPCPFSCHTLSGNSKQYWCRLLVVGKGQVHRNVWLLVLTSFSCRGSFQSATLPVFSVICVVELVIVGREV